MYSTTTCLHLARASVVVDIINEKSEIRVGSSVLTRKAELEDGEVEVVATVDGTSGSHLSCGGGPGLVLKLEGADLDRAVDRVRRPTVTSDLNEARSCNGSSTIDAVEDAAVLEVLEGEVGDAAALVVGSQHGGTVELGDHSGNAVVGSRVRNDTSSSASGFVLETLPYKGIVRGGEVGSELGGGDREIIERSVNVVNGASTGEDDGEGGSQSCGGEESRELEHFGGNTWSLRLTWETRGKVRSDSGGVG